MPPVLVVGTRNVKKRQEILEILADLGLDVRDLTSYPDAPDVVEDGDTFEANVRKKASELARHLKQWVLGEDSGLVVPGLNGRPGVYSARYAGKQGDDAANNQRLLAELAPLSEDHRAAYYVCTAALADPSGEVKAVVEGRCHGVIIDEYRGEGGFGYDPLFLIPEYHKTFGELSARVKHAESSRTCPVSIASAAAPGDARVRIDSGRASGITSGAYRTGGIAVTTISLPSSPATTTGPRPVRWTCAEFHRFGDLGMFEGRRAMLIDGVILEEGPMNPPHAITLGLVEEAIRSAFGAGWWLRHQSPLILGQALDPEPDLVVVPGRPRDYTGHPTTADLVIEVSDSSLDFDTNEKRRLYARASLREYWVVDINGRRLLVYRDPLAGDYATQQTLGPTDTLSPLASPAATIRVADLLV